MPQVPGSRVRTEDGGGTTVTGRGRRREWLYISGKWYYFQEDGYMATGWITLYNKSYYLDPVSGEMYKSGRTPDGMYVNESGVYVPGM